MERLQKFLAAAGIASRRQAENLIEAGRIKVNGEVIIKLGTIIDANSDQVEFDGKIVRLPKQFVYLALNKPVGYVSSSSSQQGKSVAALVRIKQRVYPVGRLDKDSSGLLILTNDGDFANKLTHPSFGKEKEYYVVLDHQLSPKAVALMERGMILEGKRLQPAKISSVTKNTFRIILKEGVNRQIRRMLGRLGYTVVKLKRIRIGKLDLGNLDEGKYKTINKDDI